MKKLILLLLFVPLISFGQTSEGYFASANEKMKVKDYYGAIADFTKAIEIGEPPQVSMFYMNRGLAKFYLKDYSGAIADQNKSIELFPNPAPYYVRGQAKFFSGEDYSGAIADFTKAIELKPDYAIAYFFRGGTKEMLGDLRGACADWRRAASLGHSNSAKLVRDQCGVDPKTNSNNRISSSNQGNTSTNPKVELDGNAYYNRGNAKKNSGDKKGACADFEIAIRPSSKLNIDRKDEIRLLKWVTRNCY